MKQAIVIYDSDCGFCRWCLAILLRAARPGAFRALPLGTAEADSLLGDLTVEQRDASWHLVPGEGLARAAAGSSPPVRFSAGAALAPALDRVRGGRAPAALFRRFPGASERGYRWVAEHRSPLGRFVGGRARRWADRVIATQGGPPQ